MSVNNHENLFLRGRQNSVHSLLKNKPQSINEKVQSNNQQLSKAKQTKKQNKRIQRNTGNAKAFEEQSQKLKCMQPQLKKQQKQNGNLSKLSKAKCNFEVNHIDLHVQLRRLQEKLETKNQLIKLLQLQAIQSETTINSLRIQFQEQEIRHLQIRKQLQLDIEKLNQFKEVFLPQQQKQFLETNKKIEKQKLDLLNKHNSDKMLFQQIKKKNYDLVIQIKQLQNQLQIQKGSQCLLDIQNKEKIETMKIQFIQCGNQIQKLQSQLSIQKSKENQRNIQQIKMVSQIYQLKKQINSNNLQHENIIKEYETKFIQMTKEHQDQIFSFKENLFNVRKNYQKQISTALKSQEKTFSEIKHSLQMEIVRQKSQIQNTNSNLQKKQIDVAKLNAQNCKFQNTVCEIDKQNKQLKFKIEEYKTIINNLHMLQQIKQKQFLELQSRYSSLMIQLEQQKKKLFKNVIDANNKKIENNNAQQLYAINKKMQSEKHKAMGRILEITNRVRTVLQMNCIEGGDELNEQISLLAQSIDKIIFKHFTSQRRQTNIKQNLSNCAAIIEHLKNIAQVQDHFQLWNALIISLKKSNSILQINNLAYEVLLTFINPPQKADSIKTYSKDRCTHTSSYNKEQVQKNNYYKLSHQNQKLCSKELQSEEQNYFSTNMPREQFSKQNLPFKKYPLNMHNKTQVQKKYFSK